MPRERPDKDSALCKLGDAVKVRRLAAGLTQRQLANLVGCSFTAAQQWEQGLRDPGIGNLLRIARACNVSLIKLLLPLEGHDPGAFPVRPNRKYHGVREERRERRKHADDLH